MRSRVGKVGHGEGGAWEGGAWEGGAWGGAVITPSPVTHRGLAHFEFFRPEIKNNFISNFYQETFRLLQPSCSSIKY